MGAVFFLGFLIFFICICIALLAITLTLLILFIVSRYRHKSGRGFLIATIIMAILTSCAFALPIGFITNLVQMYNETCPTRGQVIEEKTFQDETFTVDGEKYIGLNYYSNIMVGDSDICEPVFTYQTYIWFIPLNAGYHYRLYDESLGFTLYCSASGENLYCSEEEYEIAKNYYETGTWLWNNGNNNNLSSEDNQIMNAVFDIIKKEEYVYKSNLNYNYQIILNLDSLDTYARKNTYYFYEIDNSFYLEIESKYSDEGYGYKMLEMSQEINNVLEKILLAN